jgi:hypothetical protein
MTTNKILPADKVTDRDIFNYITSKLLEQGQKSVDQYYDEETGDYEQSDDCRYFGFDRERGKKLQCAVGWIMNKEVYDKYLDEFNSEVEGNGIMEKEPLEIVVLSNQNWNFTKESWVMLSIMQRIHDSSPLLKWKKIFENMSYLFDSDGKFCPNYVVKDILGQDIEQDKLYYSYERGKYGVQGTELQEIYVDFEEIGISLQVLRNNANITHDIAKSIEQLDLNLFSPEATGINILTAESQETADVSEMNFLDIVDSVELNKQLKELVPNVGQ